MKTSVVDTDPYWIRIQGLLDPDPYSEHGSTNVNIVYNVEKDVRFNFKDINSQFRDSHSTELKTKNKMSPKEIFKVPLYGT